MSDSPVAADRLVGRLVKGTYLLEAKVGVGGFGAVYRARHVKLGSAVAIKYLLPHADAGARDRFEREARISASIVHPNVARVIDVDHDEEGSPYIVMEWVSGMSLRRLLHDRPGGLTLAETIELFQQFGSAMDAAHAKGIVHRDLKPENLMLSDEGGVVMLKVLDFGIARLLGSSGTLTQGLVIGTPAYIAPELTVAGSRTADHRADLYAMGLILFECLAGQPAFRGEAMEIVSGHILGTLQLPSLSSVKPGMPPEVEAVLARACARQPGDRYATAGDLSAALARVPPTAVAGEVATLPAFAITPNPALAGRKALTPKSLGSPSGLQRALTAPAEAMTVTPGVAGSSLAMAASEIVSMSDVAGGRRRGRRALALAIVGVIVVGGAAAGWKVFGGGGKREVAPDERPIPAVVVPPAVARLQLVGLPDGARVSDASNPGKTFELSDGAIVLHRSTQPVELHIEAEGFEPLEQEVVPDADARVTISLKRLPPPVVPETPTVKPPAHHHVVPKTHETTTPNHGRLEPT